MNPPRIIKDAGGTYVIVGNKLPGCALEYCRAYGCDFPNCHQVWASGVNSRDRAVSLLKVLTVARSVTGGTWDELWNNIRERNEKEDQTCT